MVFCDLRSSFYAVDALKQDDDVTRDHAMCDNLNDFSHSEVITEDVDAVVEEVLQQLLHEVEAALDPRALIAYPGNYFPGPGRILR